MIDEAVAEQTKSGMAVLQEHLQSARCFGTRHVLSRSFSQCLKTCMVQCPGNSEFARDLAVFVSVDPFKEKAIFHCRWAACGFKLLNRASIVARLAPLHGCLSPTEYSALQKRRESLDSAVENLFARLIKGRQGKRNR
jgi:hypothetical protein